LQKNEQYCALFTLLSIDGKVAGCLRVYSASVIIARELNKCFLWGKKSWL